MDRLEFVRQALEGAGRNARGLRLENMAGGGSDRRMRRARAEGGTWVLVENPCPQVFENHWNENDSYRYIAGLLEEAGGFAPEILACDPAHGRFLLEDLGDTHLLDLVRERGDSSPSLVELYSPVIRDLARIQAALRRRFRQDRVHNKPYDYELMTVWESGYFRERFLDGLLGLAFDGEALQEEFHALAEAVTRMDCSHFLYRDLQSTNVMYHGGRYRYIDFQGGRRGPPHYDLASLLLDPYAGLPREVRETLVDLYLECAEEELGLEGELFRREYPLVAAHRMMQALGAYGFLGVVKGKREFLQHVPAALRHLGELLSASELRHYPRLAEVVQRAALSTRPAEPAESEELSEGRRK